MQPEPDDPFRTSVRAAMLVSPDAAAYAVTAGRVHEVWELPIWKPSEIPQLIMPTTKTPGQRRGAQTHYGLRPDETEIRTGFRVATLARTVCSLAPATGLDDLVCLVDSALFLGWDPEQTARRSKGFAHLS